MELEARLARLETLSIADLRQEWQVAFGQPPPRPASRKLLVRAIAYHVQEQKSGGLNPATRRKLARLERALAEHGSLPARLAAARPIVKPGTRLLRGWQGQLHEVKVLQDGFLWKGRRYR